MPQLTFGNTGIRFSGKQTSFFDKDFRPFFQARKRVKALYDLKVYQFQHQPFRLTRKFSTYGVGDSFGVRLDSAHRLKLCFYVKDRKYENKLVVLDGGSKIIEIWLSQRSKASVLCPHPLDSQLFTYLLALEKLALFFHSAGFVVDGKGYMFLGPSDAGKSTISQLLATQDCFCDGRVVNDEKVMVASGGQIYGTPWSGTAGFRDNKSGILETIYFLRQSSQNCIQPLSQKQAYIQLFQCLYAPYGYEAGMQFAADFIEKLIGRVEIKTLCFDNTKQTVKLLKREIACA